MLNGRAESVVFPLDDVHRLLCKVVASPVLVLMVFIEGLLCLNCETMGSRHVRRKRPEPRTMGVGLGDEGCS